MGAIVAVARVVGFVRVLVVAAVLGISYLGNAFQAANSLSNVLFELLAAGALSSVLVPAFVQLQDDGDDAGAERVAGGVLGLAMAAMAVVAVVGMALAPLLARLLTLGVDPAHAADQQALVTVLLRFFLPQLVLYAAAAVATGVLYSKRSFLPTAAAPIGNTVVMVAALGLFAWVAGPDPGLELTSTELGLLVVAGTGGVIAFVGILLFACRATGFRLRPRWPGRDPQVGGVARQAGWGVVLHTSAGAILGGAIVAGAGVPGGVVAYQTAWVFFLAPYGVLANPIQTAILPELVGEARADGLAQFRRSTRWALERMTVVILPVAVALTALAEPMMRIVADVINESDSAALLLAAALAGLAVGLLPYSAFLMLARVYYALGDTRTPGLVSLAVAATGLVAMGAAYAVSEGTARIAALGLAHSLAYAVGTTTLLIGLRRRTGGSVLPRSVVAMGATAIVATAAVWLAADRLLSGRDGGVADLLVVGGFTAVGGIVLLVASRVPAVRGRLTARRPAGDPSDRDPRHDEDASITADDAVDTVLP